MSKFDLLLVGVGGQGIILASDIIGEAAIAAGLDVKKTDMMGMAQRGGSVVSHVRVAQKVASPLIEMGRVDIMLAFEKLEASRYAELIRPGGVAIVDNQAIPPLSVTGGSQVYPSDAQVRETLAQRAGQVFFVEGTAMAKKLGNVRAANTLLLGFLARFMTLGEEQWRSGLERCVKPAFLDLNVAAFKAGAEEAIRQVGRQTVVA